MNLFVQELGLQHKERNRILVPAVGGILGAERIQLLLGKIALKTCNTLAAPEDAPPEVGALRCYSFP
jgi:hypothetical protein